MLLTLAVLVIGGTGLFTGPVQAAVVNFNQTPEIRTKVDSLLCPNITYTFLCEISGVSLQLSSFDSNGSLFNFFDAAPATAAMGITSTQTEFNFTALSTVNGLAASAVMYSSIHLTSTELECRDVDSVNFSSLSTVVKHPLDSPELVNYTCFNDTDNNTYLQMNWTPVDCATEYYLDIPFLGMLTTTSTSYNLPVGERNYCGSLYAKGGASVHFCTAKCLIFFVPGPPQPEVSCFSATPTTEFSDGVNIETSYTLTFNEFQFEATTYYETSDGDLIDITVENSVAEISIDSNVTVYVVSESGTMYCSEELEEPSVSGEGTLALFWVLFALLLLATLLSLGCAIVVTAKYFSLKSKIANKGGENVELQKKKNTGSGPLDVQGYSKEFEAAND